CHPELVERRYSSIYFSEYGIERADHHDEVRDQVPRCNALERLQVIHARRTRANAVRAILAVAHDVVTKLAARTLDGLIDVARRHAETFAHDLEVVDECFHRKRDRLFRRRDDLRIVDIHGTRLVQPFANLLDDTDRLVHLIESHEEARVGIAFRTRRNLELNLIV